MVGPRTRFIESARAVTSILMPRPRNAAWSSVRAGRGNRFSRQPGGTRLIAGSGAVFEIICRGEGYVVRTKQGFKLLSPGLEIEDIATAPSISIMWGLGGSGAGTNLRGISFLVIGS